MHNESKRKLKSEVPEYPGLFWDETKQRYFPLTSSSLSQRQAQADRNDGSHNQNNNSVIKKRPGLIQNQEETNFASASLRGAINPTPVKLHRMKLGLTYAAKDALVHDLNSCFMKSSEVRLQDLRPKWITDNCITSLHVSNEDEWKSIIIGDSAGFLSSSRYKRHDTLLPSPLPDLCIESEITSISKDDRYYLSTSFGPRPKIAIQYFSSEDGPGSAWLLNLNETLAHDIWSEHKRGRSLVLGCCDKAVHFTDFDAFNIRPTPLKTNSDVLSVLHESDSCVLAGCRNGSVQRFDIRTADQQKFGQHLLSSRFRNGRSFDPITYLDVFDEWKLLISTMSGGLEVFDLRYSLHKDPIMTLSDHSNSVFPKLGIAVDPCHNYVFAAGQDYFVRGWSLRSGHSLSSMESGGKQTPCWRAYPDLCKALQITEEKDGLHLWVASGRGLYSTKIGPMVNQHIS